MPKGYERRRRAALDATSRTVTRPNKNFSATVEDIKATAEGRERGQAIAAAAKAKPKKKAAAKMTDAERKKRIAAMVSKNRPAIKKLAAARKAKKKG
jgi:hypothetical protein